MLQKNSATDCQIILPPYKRHAELARGGIDLALGLVWVWTLGADLARLQSPFVCQGVELALLAVYSVICAVLGIDLLWQLCGRERIASAAGRLTLSHEIGKFCLVRQFPLHQVTSISAEALPAP